MARIQLIGASGTGKSTLGAALSQRLNLPLLESDRYYWADEDFRIKRSDDEKRSMLFADLEAHEHFVFTGAPQSWAKGYPRELDLLIFLRLPQDVRMERLRRRELTRYGARAMPGGDHFEETESFLAWAATYESSGDTVGNTLASHRLLVSQAACPVLELDARQSVSELVGAIVEYLAIE